METMTFALDVVLMGAGTLLAVYGTMALVATLLFPRWLASPLFAPRMFLGRIAPTRRNRVVMATWYLALGAYVALSAAQVPLWRHVALGAVLALVVPVLRLQRVRGG